ncbi:MAG: homoserine dehydrogenase [Candidatus Omnitrophota bacterium]
MIKKVGIIGMGTVGEATIKSFKKYSSIVSRRVSSKIEIKKVCDADKSKKKIADKLKLPFTLNPYELINDPQIDIIVELIGGIEPARALIKESLKKGKDVVTANKALLASCGREIFSLAKSEDRHIGFEASVSGAIPIIKSISQGLICCDVEKIYGILNGTTNYILYKMAKENIDFKIALGQAQAKGIAEKKPDLDIEGIDSCHKLCILSYLCYGVWPSLEKVYTQGISRISLLDTIYAAQMNYSIKLLAIAKKKGRTLDLRVHPTLIPVEHPLSQVSLAYNAIYLDTQPAGELLFYGQGAGGVPTSSAVISDIVDIACGSSGLARKESEGIIIGNIKDIKTRYYIRFMAHDSPGVLSKISKVLGSFNISIASVTQKQRKRGKIVPIIMITHEAKEEHIEKAIAEINGFKEIKIPSQVIRIENL